MYNRFLERGMPRPVEYEPVWEHTGKDSWCMIRLPTLSSTLTGIFEIYIASSANRKDFFLLSFSLTATSYR